MDFVRLRIGLMAALATLSGLLPCIAARIAARRAKDFAEADRIRDALKDDGIELEDGAGGTTWRRLR